MRVSVEWPADAVREVKRLREALEEAQERAKQAEAALHAKPRRRPWGLSPSGAQIAYTLARRGPLSAQQLLDTLNFHRFSDVTDGRSKLINAQLTYIRRALPRPLAILRMNWGPSLYYFNDPAAVLKAFELPTSKEPSHEAA